MKRRTFLKQAGIAAAGTIMAPYILPTGRLFAATGARKANHVVFCMFAGGVRNIESVQHMDGNLLTNLLSDTTPIKPDIAGSMTPLPASPLSYKLDTIGALFKEFRYKQGPTGHFNGHTVALTGQYSNTDLVIKENPKVPTIFEYYRKHNSPLNSATNCWWVANSLGPYPALNYSSASGYGAAYGANFIAPTALFSDAGKQTIKNVYNFSNNDKQAIDQLKGFTNQVFNHPYSNGDAGIVNTESDSYQLDQFINKIFASPTNPWGISNGMSNDMLNIYYAEEILKEFKPELLVVNMQDVDVAHFNFTNYANNLRKADYAVAHLWNTIQSIPGMQNDTILIVAPEHGRNLAGNNSVDANGRKALDHTANVDLSQGDQTAREIFCLVVGPSSVVKQGYTFGSASSPVGESIEIVPAIANILGFDTEIPGGLLVPSSSNQFLLNGFL